MCGNCGSVNTSKDESTETYYSICCTACGHTGNGWTMQDANESFCLLDCRGMPSRHVYPEEYEDE